LREDGHFGDLTVGAVRESEVDNSVLPAEDHGRLGPLFRQDRQAVPLAAGEDHGEHRVHRLPRLAPAGHSTQESKADVGTTTTGRLRGHIEGPGGSGRGAERPSLTRRAPRTDAELYFGHEVLPRRARANEHDGRGYRGERGEDPAGIAEARDRGCAIVAFPELAVTGYPEDLVLRREFSQASVAAVQAWRLLRRTSSRSWAALAGTVTRATPRPSWSMAIGWTGTTSGGSGTTGVGRGAVLCRRSTHPHLPGPGLYVRSQRLRGHLVSGAAPDAMALAGPSSVSTSTPRPTRAGRSVTASGCSPHGRPTT
jgi:hypothetical protein